MPGLALTQTGFANSRKELPHVIPGRVPTMTEEQRQALQDHRNQYIGDLSTAVVGDGVVSKQVQEAQKDFAALRAQSMAATARRRYHTSVGGARPAKTWAPYYRDLAFRRQINTGVGLSTTKGFLYGNN